MYIAKPMTQRGDRRCPKITGFIGLEWLEWTLKTNGKKWSGFITNQVTRLFNPNVWLQKKRDDNLNTIPQRQHKQHRALKQKGIPHCTKNSRGQLPITVQKRVPWWISSAKPTNLLARRARRCRSKPRKHQAASASDRWWSFSADVGGRTKTIQWRPSPPREPWWSTGPSGYPACAVGAGQW